LFFSGIKQMENAVIVVHCEKSKTRGPRMAAFLRALDREMNMYPKVTYHNLFILHGGYREYFEKFPEDCEGGYVSMDDEAHARSGEMAHETTRWKRKIAKWQRKRRSVAHAYTYDGLPTSREIEPDADSSSPKLRASWKPRVLSADESGFESPTSKKRELELDPRRISGERVVCWVDDW
jgi:hypothetical protein